ncbi:acyl-CoA thioesterase [Jeotgalibacillus proteolyticus]|uniref:Acyl-CoA thioesterase n=1 Tax=Jeotgalibacillus proteolyticus TaxID=2082395 RepID=A0A2S5G8G9_9BACL|nr:thioesterase family protein [Jeotgalibacillus proteolyticus]PPA69292.1 acyl-CoA thioesterase [Jeotgalibacillus proteolyticus]
MLESSVRVRFCETDALGHVNNTSYFIYLEEARIQFFESLGYQMDVDNWKFIIASTKCDFKSQGYFNQDLSITSSISHVGGKSFQLEHQIRCSQTGMVIAEGNAVIVYYDFENQKSAPIPEELRAGLMEHLTKGEQGGTR